MESTEHPLRRAVRRARVLVARALFEAALAIDAPEDVRVEAPDEDDNDLPAPYPAFVQSPRARAMTADGGARRQAGRPSVPNAAPKLRGSVAERRQHALPRRG